MGAGVVIAIAAGVAMFVVVGWVLYKGIFTGDEPSGAQTGRPDRR